LVNGYLIDDIEKALSNLSPSDFVRHIDSAIEILRKERERGFLVGGKINGGLVELQTPDELVVIGDIHGDLKTFLKILEDIKLEHYLANPNNKIILLGDYVDRGPKSIEVLYAICNLKQRYPNSIILMRGNHEAPAEYPFSSHDLPLKIIDYYGMDMGKFIYYKKIFPFFRLLMLTTIIQKLLLLVHGGLPTIEVTTTNYRSHIANAQENILQNRIMEEILWNDPRSEILGGHDWEKSRRGVGKHFGINISRKWLEATGTRAIIRGHEPCEGYKLDHAGIVITIFSCKDPYPNFDAAYISIAGKKLESIRTGADLVDYTIKV